MLNASPADVHVERLDPDLVPVYLRAVREEAV
jgi:hypothetical protein